ncbi:MAG TPA: sulfite reductase subunit A [Gammaproteobacteria bacterium]|nr:sulfite reductase subunit A [Gammaproteobacteria bacterium]
MNPVSFLMREDLNALINALKRAGYRCMGPQAKDGAIVYAELNESGLLPRGMTDKQSPCEYRLEATDSPQWFNWANGPQALKPLTFTPREILWRSSRNSDGRLDFSSHTVETSPLAFIGARACDLAALQLQRQHFLDAQRDAAFESHCDQLFIVAVHCHHPAATCFCASTGDGPEAKSGFDIALHELDEGFLMQTGSDAGERIAAQLPLTEADVNQLEHAEQALLDAAKAQQRSLPPGSLKEALFARLDHSRWDDIAERCLSCGNCTAVCPTCFCHRESDEAALDGQHSEHIREWDSCFSSGHSYIHGIVIRSDTRSRYRQWLTHKLGGWHDQYGRSGCVGCGRCISWCPVGIDMTEEVYGILGD